MSCGDTFEWAWAGLRKFASYRRSGARNGAYAALAALILVGVFGALFAAADPVFATYWDSLGSVLPSWSPLPFAWFLAGAAGALLVGHGAVAPLCWDRITVPPAKPLGRNVWLTPLAALALLFALFDAIQVSVLFGDLRSVLKSTGMSYADYARQGFWQLIGATALTIVVLAVAIRWSPRGGPRDALVASIALCTLSALALVVVGSALRRMQLDIDAYGLTLPRVSVVAIEIWLGLLFIILMAARCRPATTWLPRAVALSVVMVLGTTVGIGPAHLVAQVDVNRYLNGQYVDLTYLRGLPPDARAEIARLPVSAQYCLSNGLPAGWTTC